MPVDLLDMPGLMGENLKKLRIIREFTLEVVAQKINISKSMLSLVEVGERRLKFVDLIKLLKVYGYTVARFFSEVQDCVPGGEYSPTEVIHQTRMSILVDGSRQYGMYHMLLLRPMRHPNDIAIFELYLPPKIEVPKEGIVIDGEVRGLVKQGELLVHFSDDEFHMHDGDEFVFDGSRPHLYRNHTLDPSIIYLIFENNTF